jgi:hypothetical protein
MLDKEFFRNDGIIDDFLCREQTRNLFGQPDVMLIDEYLHVYQSTIAHTPEMRLIAAVLEDAIACYLKYCSANTRRGKRIFGEAEQWIFSRDDNCFFAFENICEILKIDPDYIRRVLRHSRLESLRQDTLSAHRLPLDLPTASLRWAS